MKLVSLLCLASLIAGGCHAPLPAPISPAFRKGEGYQGCRAMSEAARAHAAAASRWGWLFSIAGAGAAATGTTIIPLDGALSNTEKIAAGSLTLGGALLFAVGHAWFKRSDAASTLAGETSSILGERKDGAFIDEAQMVSRCNVALGAWERSRTDATEVASSLLQDQKKSTKAAELEGEQAREKTLQMKLQLKLKALEGGAKLVPDPLDEDGVAD